MDGPFDWLSTLYNPAPLSSSAFGSLGASNTVAGSNTGQAFNDRWNTLLGIKPPSPPPPPALPQGMTRGLGPVQPGAAIPGIGAPVTPPGAPIPGIGQPANQPALPMPIGPPAVPLPPVRPPQAGPPAVTPMQKSPGMWEGQQQAANPFLQQTSQALLQPLMKPNFQPVKWMV